MSSPWTYPCPCACCSASLSPEAHDGSIHTKDGQRVCSEECRDEYDAKETAAEREERLGGLLEDKRDGERDDAMGEKPQVPT